MERRRLLLLAASLALPLTAINASSGHTVGEDPPSRVVLDDPVDDVWGIGEASDWEWVTVDLPTADVVRAVVRHGRHNVVVKLTFSNLRRVDPQNYWAGIRSRNDWHGAWVSTGPEHWKGQQHLTDLDENEVTCPRLSHSIDYSSEQLVMTVPRGCIGRPAWVSARMRNFIWHAASVDDFEEITDNPFSATYASRMSTGRLYQADG